MRFYSQNLNDKSAGRQGSKLRHGRCWWHWGRASQRSIGLEWHFLNPRLSIGVGLAEHDYALSAHFCIGFINLYVHLEHGPLYWWLQEKTKREGQRYGNGRTIGFSWFEGSLSVDLWYDPMEHRSVDPKWWHFYFTPNDFFFGRTKYEERTLRESRVEVPMPEASYPATVRLYEAVWRRSRWPWPWHRVVRADVTPDKPIPFPGKGENSWDCGEDATHSLTCSASDESEAVAHMVQSVLRDRYRHGGKQWRPQEATA